MAAPTFVSETEAAWNGNTDPLTTGSISVQSGDILVAFSVIENYTVGDPGVATVSGGSLTWTKRQEVAVNNTTNCNIHTATAGSTTSITVSVAYTSENTALWRGLNVLVFRSSDGVGATAKTNGTGAPSLSITTTQANSAIVVASGDWNAVDGASRTWRTAGSAATEVTYFRDSSHYVAYGAYHADAGTVAAKTVGLSAPTGQTYSIVAVEVKGTALAAATSFVIPTKMMIQSILAR